MALKARDRTDAAQYVYAAWQALGSARITVMDDAAHYAHLVALDAELWALFLALGGKPPR